MKIFKEVLGDLQTNCYILCEGNRALVVDVPYNGEKRLHEFIRSNGLIPVAVLLTHGHLDHCGGANAFAAKDSLPIYVHEADESLCRNAAWQISGLKADNCFPTHLLSGEDEKLNIQGFELRMINTPGHTPGSCIFLAEGIMLTGDTLFAGSVGRSDLPMGDPNAMRRSIMKLKGIDGSYVVYPGHGGATTLDEEKKSNFYLK